MSAVQLAWSTVVICGRSAANSPWPPGIPITLMVTSAGGPVVLVVSPTRISVTVVVVMAPARVPLLVVVVVAPLMGGVPAMLHFFLSCPI